MQDEAASTVPTLHTSPSGRRVHFVQPYPGSSAETNMDISAFAEAAKLAETR